MWGDWGRVTLCSLFKYALFALFSCKNQEVLLYWRWILLWLEVISGYNINLGRSSRESSHESWVLVWEGYNSLASASFVIFMNLQFRMQQKKGSEKDPPCRSICKHLKVGGWLTVVKSALFIQPTCHTYATARVVSLRLEKPFFFCSFMGCKW